MNILIIIRLKLTLIFQPMPLFMGDIEEFYIANNNHFNNVKITEIYGKRKQKHNST